MARRPLNVSDPEQILENLINDYIEGKLDDSVVLYRALVVEIDHVGGVLEEEPVPNPRNSIRARIITNSIDSHVKKEKLGVYWPMFPFDVMPLKEGEHVYVFFENSQELDHGLWLTRIPEHNGVHNPNLTLGKKQYEENPDAAPNEVSLDQAVQDVDGKTEEPVRSKEFVVEEGVPRFRARVGDRVIEGSNNTLIVLGRDRPSNSESGVKEEAGTIDIVAGRNAENDMSMADDQSRIYITMQSDGDENFEIEDPALSGDSDGTPAESAGVDSYAVIKSNQVRIAARGAFKINVGEGNVFKLAVSADGSISIETGGTVDIKADGDATIDAPKVVVKTDESYLGSASASEGILHGNAFADELKTFLNALLTDASGGGLAFTIPGSVQFLQTAAAIPSLIAKLSPAPAGVISAKHKLDSK